MTYDYFADLFRQLDNVRRRLPTGGSRREREQGLSAFVRSVDEMLGGAGADWHAAIEAMALWQQALEADGKRDHQILRDAYQAKLGARQGGENDYTLPSHVVQRFRDLGLDSVPTERDLKRMPDGSFLLRFEFTLARPYLSKDDEPLYPYDNPVVKDVAFKIPMVRPSSWKGALRAACQRLLEELSKTVQPFLPDADEAREKAVTNILTRLFGNEQDEKNNFCRGRLLTFPTFFNRLTIEFINPHSRRTKAGTNPIPMEAVPAKATGTFAVLYTPFGGSEPFALSDLSMDLAITVLTAQRLLLWDGFGAKTSNDYGCAEPTCQNMTLAVKPERPALKIERQSQNISELAETVRAECANWIKEVKKTL